MVHQIKTAPYRDRRTWLIGIREICGWQLKVHGICAAGRQLKEVTIESALAHAEKHVRWPDRESGFGFITLHFGEQAVWLLVDLWVEDILRHFLYQAPLAQPDQFTDGPTDGTMACVWELAVMQHERASWIKHVLSRPEDPDYQVYLRDSIEI
jgi:hypothetical protein